MPVLIFMFIIGICGAVIAGISSVPGGISNYPKIFGIALLVSVVISVYLVIAGADTFQAGTVVYEYKIHVDHNNSGNEVQWFYDYENHVLNVQDTFHVVADPKTQHIVQRVREYGDGVFWMGTLDSLCELKQL